MIMLWLFAQNNQFIDNLDSNKISETVHVHCAASEQNEEWKKGIGKEEWAKGMSLKS